MKKQKDFFGLSIRPPEACIKEITRGGIKLLVDLLSTSKDHQSLVKTLSAKYKLNTFKSSKVTIKNQQTSVEGVSFSVRIDSPRLNAKLGKPKRSSLTVLMGLIDSKDENGQPLAGMFFDDQYRLDLYLKSLPYWSKLEQYVGDIKGINTLVRSLEMASGHELIHAIQEMYSVFDKEDSSIDEVEAKQKADPSMTETEKYYLDPEEYHPLLLTVVDLLLIHLQKLLIRVKTSRDTPKGKKLVADVFLVVTGLSDPKEQGIDAIVKQSTKITGFMQVLRDKDPKRWKQAVTILIDEVLKPLLKD